MAVEVGGDTEASAAAFAREGWEKLDEWWAEKKESRCLLRTFLSRVYEKVLQNQSASTQG